MTNKQFKIYDLDKGEHPGNMPGYIKWMPLYILLEKLSHGCTPTEEQWNYALRLAKESDEYYANYLVENKPLAKRIEIPSSYRSQPEPSFRSIELAPCPPEWQALERNKV